MDFNHVQPGDPSHLSPSSLGTFLRYERFRVELHSELQASGPPILWKDSDGSEAQFVELGEKMLTAVGSKFMAPDRVLGVEVPFELWLTEPETERALPPLVGACDAQTYLCLEAGAGNL